MNRAAMPKSWGREIVEFVGLLTLIFLIRTFIFGLYFVPSGSMETTLLVGDSLVSDKLSVWFKPIERGEIIAFNQPTYEYASDPLKNMIQRYLLGIFWGPQNWTKRVIAIPGDHIKGVLEDGKPVVYLNGKKLDEPYVNTYPLAYALKFSGHKEQSSFLRSISDISPVSWDVTKSPSDQPFYKVPSDRLLSSTGTSYAVNPELRLDYPQTPLYGREGIVLDVFDVHLGPNQYFVMGDNRKGSFDSRGWGVLDGSLIHGRIRFRLFSFDDPDSNWMIISLLKDPLHFLNKIRWSRCMQWVS